MLNLLNTNWFVITGASCSGKTKVIERLSFLGYKTFPEISRLVIDNELSKGKNINDIINNQKNFEETILKNKFELESRVNVQEKCFFDRSVIDSIAFIKLRNVKDLNVDLFVTKKYKNIFFMESLKYVYEKSRFESDQERLILEKYIVEAYESYGYKLVYICKDSVENRVENILKHLNYGS
jgi:predicted ATPase